MADIPTGGMKATVMRIIETLGESMDFQRRDALGEWGAASTGVVVHTQPVGSTHMRDHTGIGVEGCRLCFAGSDADILPGDRTALEGSWHLVTRLLDRETHLEFQLEKTAEAVE
ncbi:MAG: hypothetical protein JW885_11525 [Deltaproteobacteria bacterium]|nr:hypothetical protein [Candidatus Zymogenaceae bacterium]